MEKKAQAIKNSHSDTPTVEAAAAATVSYITISTLEYHQLKEKTIEQEAQINRLSEQIEWLMEQMRLARKYRFGTSSEKSVGQVCFDEVFNELEHIIAKQNAKEATTQVKSHTRKPKRRLLAMVPPGTPVEEIVHGLAEDERVCPECGELMPQIGRQIARTEVRIIPAQVSLVRHVTMTYACRNCEETSIHTPIKQGEAPNAVIEGGNATPESIAHIAVQKYANGMPLYRQEQDWARQGIDLSRQTMSNWLMKAGEEWLKPIYERLTKLLLLEGVLHADDTGLKVLHEDGKKSKSKSRMYLYRTSGCAKRAIVVYEYRPDWGWDNPKEFLAGYKGYLHTDGHEGYHQLPGDIIPVGCWAHVRRGFTDAVAAAPKEKRDKAEANKGVAYLDRLFRLEREWDEQGISWDERKQMRLKHAVPIIEAFYAWVNEMSKRTFPKSKFGDALRTALSQRKYVENYLLDGRLEISNNRAERSIKPFVIGRKNWLFSNTADGAKSSAIYYSLIETAKENGMNPFEYLSRVFREAPNRNTGHSWDDLLPCQTAAAT